MYIPNDLPNGRYLIQHVRSGLDMHLSTSDDCCDLSLTTQLEGQNTDTNAIWDVYKTTGGDYFIRNVGTGNYAYCKYPAEEKSDVVGSENKSLFRIRPVPEGYENVHTIRTEATWTEDILSLGVNGSDYGIKLLASVHQLWRFTPHLEEKDPKHEMMPFTPSIDHDKTIDGESIDDDRTLDGDSNGIDFNYDESVPKDAQVIKNNYGFLCLFQPTGFVQCVAGGKKDRPEKSAIWGAMEMTDGKYLLKNVGTETYAYCPAGAPEHTAILGSTHKELCGIHIEKDKRGDDYYIGVGKHKSTSFSSDTCWGVSNVYNGVYQVGVCPYTTAKSNQWKIIPYSEYIQDMENTTRIWENKAFRPVGMRGGGQDE